MPSLSLALYHRLPPKARDVAATLHGLSLRRWRYGPETERLVAEAAERETWPAERWRLWREERLAYVLQRAATRVPFYRDQWRRRRAAGDRRSWERLEHWPRLAKDEVRAAPQRFVADDCEPPRMYHEHTSGTTGTPIDLWWSRSTVREWYALFELRCRQWHGVSRLDRWAILGGQLVVPPSRRQPPFWVWNAAMNQLYLSTNHLAPAWMPLYLEALDRHRIRYLWGYPSALYELAQCALKRRHTSLRLEVVLGNAEPLHDYQRDVIAAAFGCSVRETYGMAEIVTAASECPHGRLHLWPEVGVVEVENPDASGTGDLVATGLLNADMPLIRYEVGDRVRPPAPEATCPCGRTLGVLPQVEGRADDVLVAPDGRRLVRLDPIFKAGLPIVEAQIVQDSPTALRVVFVPTEDYWPHGAARLKDAIRTRVGDFDIALEPVPRIPRDANGKFRAVISQVAAARTQ